VFCQLALEYPVSYGRQQHIRLTGALDRIAEFAKKVK
jgi:hypothetical protein